MTTQYSASQTFSAHRELLGKYKSLIGAQGACYLGGAFFALALFGYIVQPTVAQSQNALLSLCVGGVMALVGYLVGFRVAIVRKAMRDNWSAAFVGTEWKTLAGEVGTAIETDLFAQSLRLSFGGAASGESYSLNNLRPVSARSQELKGLAQNANPYDRRLHPIPLMLGALVLAFPLLAISVVLFGVVLWLLAAVVCCLQAGALDSLSRGGGELLRRTSVTRWRALDGRVGIVRAAERRGSQESGFTEYLTLGFDNGAEFTGQKADMVPVHDGVQTL
jgi:hypothetical protein